MNKEEALTRYDRIRYNLLNSDEKASVDVAFEALRGQEAVTNRNGLNRTESDTVKVVDSDQFKPGWISVEDRLPQKITNKVLVYCKNGYIGFGHYEKFQGVEDWYNLESGKQFREWNLEDCETYEVTHWMPLPEPPQSWCYVEELPGGDG